MYIAGLYSRALMVVEPQWVERSPGMRQVGVSIPGHVKEKVLKTDFPQHIAGSHDHNNQLEGCNITGNPWRTGSVG